MTSNLWRISATVAVGAAGLCTALAAQRNSTVPQPMADSLRPVAVPTPSRGALVDKPAAVMPTVPAGFTVSVYAELQAPRMMVYAPNGDLFVSSPADQQHHRAARCQQRRRLRAARRLRAGRARRRGAAPQAARPAQAARARAGAAAAAAPVNPAVNGPVLGASAPACAPPPAFHTPGPGTLAAPFGMAFNNGYLYVGNTGSLVRYRYTQRRSAGAGRAREAARPARWRPFHAQHRLQPRRHEDVRRRRIAVEQQRRRGLPPRGHPRVQPGRHPAIASTRPASAIRSD